MSINSLSEHVDLPQNEAQWKALAERTTIPSLPTKLENQDEQNLPGSSRTVNHPADNHVGEKVSELSLRQVAGWPSASQMTVQHYVLTRALWKFYYANQLKDCVDKGYWSEKAKKDAEKALKSDKQWDAYLRDIRKNAATDKDKKIDVGKFTSTRSFQLRIRNESPTVSPEGNISSRTRAKSKKVVSPTAKVANSSAVKAISEAETQINNPSNKGDTTRETRSPSTQTGGTTAGGLSNFSAAHPDSAKNVFARSKDEESVNMALVNFLDVLSYYCQEARKLRWDPDRQNVTFTVEKATIVAKTDGRLSKREAPSDSQNFAIVEVKPFILRENAEKTLMQMGIEMVAWIGQSVNDNKAVSPYILISQHRQEVFVTFAKPERGYKDYLDRNGPKTMTPEESGFLTLHCFGPFDIFDAKHIRVLGQLVLRLTIDANMRCSNQA